jgi:23S rRNA (adenine2503-C2)-methyltransferase
VSTIGRPEALARLAEWGLERINLAVSLFAAADDLRSAFIPANRSGGLVALRQALLALPLGRGRRVMLSVVVIPGINDGPAAVADLAAFAHGLPALVNLIPFNPIPGRAWRSPDAAEMAAVRDRLDAAGIHVRLRRTKGEAVMAACGQLGGGAGGQDP